MSSRAWRTLWRPSSRRRRVEAARRIGERLKVDVTPIVRLLELRIERRELMEVETQDLFAAYIDCLSRLIEAVDKLDGTAGSE